MLAAGQLYIRPTKWEVADIDGVKFIECTGITSYGASIYLRLPCNLTAIVNGAGASPSATERFIAAQQRYDVLDVRQSDKDRVLVVRATKVSNLTNFSNDVRDPYGSLSSLWSELNIGPYEWLIVSNYTPLPSKYTIYDLNVTTNETSIAPLIDDEPVINLKLMFIDYRPHQECLYVTSINDDNQSDYKFSWHTDAVINSYSTKVHDVQQALHKAFGIYSYLRPHLLLYFGTDTLTTLQQHLSLYNPRLSKAFNCSSVNHGLPLIDVQQFMAKFYSMMPYNTIEQLLTKCQLSTLYDLCTRFNVVDTCTTVCNNLGVSYYDLLNAADIVDRIIYNIDAAAVVHITTPTLNRLHITTSKNSRYVYDYTKYYLHLMSTSNNELLISLAHRLEGAYSSLIAAVFFSKYIDNVTRTALLSQLQRQLQQLPVVDDITMTHIYSSQRLTSTDTGDWLQLVTL